MAIVYPISFPNVSVLNVNIRARNVVGASVSPFTGQQQVYKHPGEWWEMEVSLPPLVRDQAEVLNAFLISLKGRYGTFLMGDPANKTPRGVASGSPLVAGASQVGDTLVTAGWTPSVTGILKAGDWIQLGTASATRLHKVLEDVNSDGTGVAQIPIWPSLRQSPPDNSAVVISNAKGQWRLSTNDHDYTIQTGKLYGITFACVEAL